MCIESYKMPRTPIDFSRTVIYQFVCKDVNILDRYIGRTINFVKRTYAHKTACNNMLSPHYQLYVYQFIRENGGFDNWSMIEVEKYPCKNKLEASKRERYWFEKLHATLNKQVPSRTLQEYKSVNRELLNAKNKIYYNKNIDTIREHRTVYKSKNRESLNAKNKIYRDENKIAIKKYRDDYRVTHKEIICKHCLCTCGQFYSKQHKSRHCKSKKHIDRINLFETVDSFISEYQCFIL
jgi:hypothetical protein